MTTPIERARAALADESLPPEELSAVSMELRAHRVESRRRYEELTKGRARRAALHSGDPEAVTRLDEDVRQLEAELEILKHLETELARVLKIAKAKAAASRAPEAYAELDELVQAEHRAMEQLKIARRNTDDRLRSLQQARVDWFRAGAQGRVPELPAADPELLIEWIKVRGFEFGPGGWGAAHRTIEQAAEALGLPVPSNRMASIA